MPREIKIVVLGSSGVGKSALTLRFVQGVFVERYDPTIEDSYRKTITINNASRSTESFQLEILDTAGTEQLAAMRDLYVRTGHAFLLVYSVTSSASFQEAIDIYDQIRRAKDAIRVPLVLVANKADLESERMVTRSQGEQLAHRLGVGYVETSARAGVNVEECFTQAVQRYLSGHAEQDDPDAYTWKRNQSSKRSCCNIV